MKRTIAAILAADIAGYSRLTAEDEEDTLRRLGEYSAAFREAVARVDGRVFNTAGDAILAEFPSAVEALRAAIDIQQTLRLKNQDHPPSRRIEFRIGITIGDVVERDGDMLGDGVNIAARLQTLADPGGICISRSLHEAVSGKVAVAFRDMGSHNLKNIPHPVHALRVVLPGDQDARLLKPNRLKQAAFVLAGFGIAAGSAALATFIYNVGDANRAISGPVAQERTAHLTVSVARPQRKCYKDVVRLSGVLAARNPVEVRPETEGLRVVRVLADPLSEVTSGQILAQLGPQDDTSGTTIPVRSPVAGTIGKSAAVPGMPASPRADPLFQIAAQGEIELVAEAPLAALKRLAPGQSVTVTPLGTPDIPGRVRVVSTDVDGATQLGRVRILLDRASGLRWGTFARGLVSIGERCGLGVPLGALANGPEGTTIYIANNNRIEARPVTTGLFAGNEVEIRRGIAEGDLVVLRAGPFIREGDLIRPVIANTVASAQ
jgi:class 3 adenylate cyclase